MGCEPVSDIAAVTARGKQRVPRQRTQKIDNESNRETYGSNINDTGQTSLFSFLSPWASDLASDKATSAARRKTKGIVRYGSHYIDDGIAIIPGSGAENGARTQLEFLGSAKITGRSWAGPALFSFD